MGQRKETLGPLVDVLRNATGGKDNDSTLYSGAGSASTSIRSAAESNIKIGGGVGLQLLYHILLVIWQLSFEGRLVGQGLDEELDITPLYTQLLRVSPKEKTTRLLLGALYHLLWSPPHKNADFWRENALKVIETDNGDLCKQLATILSKDWSSDKQVLAIGCND